MKIKILNLNNEAVGELDLNETIFARAWNPDLVHQVVLAQAANLRKPWAHTKSRAEVKGGGKKPWAQTGTGRARHGSINSPLWVGGGVAFGPRKDRSFAQKINKKMVRAALHSVLSKKLADQELLIVDSLTLKDHKTKNMVQTLSNLKAKSALLVSEKGNKNLHLACANLAKVECVEASSLNVTSLLSHKHLIIDQAAIANIK